MREACEDALCLLVKHTEIALGHMKYTVEQERRFTELFAENMPFVQSLLFDGLTQSAAIAASKVKQWEMNTRLAR